MMQDARLAEQPVRLSCELEHRSPEFSVIVPTFNEAPNVELVVEALVASLAGIAWEVIFVDDDSSDGTTNVVRLIARCDGRVRCIRRIGRRGLAGASIEGMLSSSAPVIAIMDGDMQHDVSLLPEMLRRIRAGDDLVIASRFCHAGSATEGLSRTRLGASRAATRLARTFLHIDVSDPMSGYFAIGRPTFEALAPRLSSQGFKILMDILASTPQPLRTSEVPLRFRARQHGVSKLDNLVAAEYLGLLLAKLTGDVLSLRFVVEFQSDDSAPITPSWIPQGAVVHPEVTRGGLRRCHTPGCCDGYSARNARAFRLGSAARSRRRRGLCGGGCHAMAAFMVRSPANGFLVGEGDAGDRHAAFRQ